MGLTVEVAALRAGAMRQRQTENSLNIDKNIKVFQFICITM